MSEFIQFFVAGLPRPRGSKTAMPIYDRKTGLVRTRNAPKICRKTGKVLKYAQPILNYQDAAKGSSQWMKEVATVAGRHAPSSLWDGPVTMQLHFSYHYNKTDLSTAKGKEDQPKASAPEFKLTTPDTTKLIRGVEDALKGIIFTDDSRVVKQHATKAYSQAFQGVLVRLWNHADIQSYDDVIEYLLEKQTITKPF